MKLGFFVVGLMLSVFLSLAVMSTSDKMTKSFVPRAIVSVDVASQDSFALFRFTTQILLESSRFDLNDGLTKLTIPYLNQPDGSQLITSWNLQFLSDKGFLINAALRAPSEYYDGPTEVQLILSFPAPVDLDLEKSGVQFGQDVLNQACNANLLTCKPVVKLPYRGVNLSQPAGDH